MTHVLFSLLGSKVVRPKKAWLRGACLHSTWVALGLTSCLAHAEDLAQCPAIPLANTTPTIDTPSSATTTFNTTTADQRDELYPPLQSPWNELFGHFETDQPGHLRFALSTPGGQIHLDVEVLINGRPYPTLRDQWIDAALEAVRAPPPSSASTQTSPSAGDSSNPGATEASGLRGALAGPQWAQDKLVHYLRTCGKKPDRDDMHFLLTEWLRGGPMRVTRDTFTLQRYSRLPLWHFLDADRNNQLTPPEIASARSRLHGSDRDQDEQIALSELEGSQPSGLPGSPWQPTSRIDWSPFPVHDSDLTFTIRLGSSEAQPSCRLHTISPKLQQAGVTIDSTDEAIVITTPTYELAVSAAQPVPAEEAEAQGCISLASIFDGFELWRRIDRDRNQRLTLREIDELPAELERLDANHDGAVDRRELPVSLRLCIGLGPSAHQPLERVGTTPLRRTTEAKKPNTPDWFAAMDQNHDGEVSRKEFVGGSAQFANLDSNQDQLISLSEATTSSE